MQDIRIVNYRTGNIGSIVNMLRKVGGRGVLASKPEDLKGACKIILPGVGSFDTGAGSLAENGLDAAIFEAARRGDAYLLGVCLGMQLLFDGSEEGRLEGLRLVPGMVRRFKMNDSKLRVPHMGWNIVHPTRHSRLFPPADDQRFYFVHSYHGVCDDPDDVAAVSHHGYRFVCAVERENVMGVQFHPEKSHRFGMALLKRFVDLR